MCCRSLATIFALLCLVTLAGCSGPSREIVGKWSTSADANAMVWEFNENGTVMQGSTRCRYSFGDNNRLKIETPFATSVYAMQLAGDKLTLTDSHGTPLSFTRVKSGGR